MTGFLRFSFVVVLTIIPLVGQSLVASGQSTDSFVPLPSPRPHHTPPVEPDAVLLLPQSDAAKIPGDSACLVQLRALAEVQLATPPETSDPACIVDNPVSLEAIQHPYGSVQMPADMLNNCGFALSFSRWIADVANPLAIQHLGGTITAVRSGKGFVCRRRNNLPTGKLSEHSFGNAIDIIGFDLANGAKFNVREASKLPPNEAGFLDALRKTACGYFTTVLGPGSNPAHATHLHVDLGKHGKSGNYRICE
jgi:hypothetical protein